MFYIKCPNCNFVFSSTINHDEFNFICPKCGKIESFYSTVWRFYERFDDWDEPVSRIIPFIGVCPKCGEITTIGERNTIMYCVMCDKSFKKENDVWKQI